MAYKTDGFGFGGFALTPVVKRLLFANVAVFLLTLALPSPLLAATRPLPEHVVRSRVGALRESTNIPRRRRSGRAVA